jgi:hypothetical protein
MHVSPQNISPRSCSAHARFCIDSCRNEAGSRQREAWALVCRAMVWPAKLIMNFGKYKKTSTYFLNTFLKANHYYASGFKLLCSDYELWRVTYQMLCLKQRSILSSYHQKYRFRSFSRFYMMSQEILSVVEIINCKILVELTVQNVKRGVRFNET